MIIIIVGPGVKVQQVSLESKSYSHYSPWNHCLWDFPPLVALGGLPISIIVQALYRSSLLEDLGYFHSKRNRSCTMSKVQYIMTFYYVIYIASKCLSKAAHGTSFLVVQWQEMWAYVKLAQKSECHPIIGVLYFTSLHCFYQCF